MDTNQPNQIPKSDQEYHSIPTEQMLADAGLVLDEFASDYERMAR